MGAKRAATQRLAVLFAEVDELLTDGIDTLVYPLRKGHPEFHAAYDAARLVVNRPGARSASAKSEETETPDIVPVALPTSTQEKAAA